MRSRISLSIFALLFVVPSVGRAADTVRVGSKVFTESIILGDIAAQLIADSGVPADHKRQLGGTRIPWEALLRGEIDIYPEYTGTISQEILASRHPMSESQMRDALAQRGILMTRTLGFNDTYAIGMRRDVADKYGVKSISDLAKHPELRFGFSNEFMDRADCWPSLRPAYHLPQTDVKGLDHDLAYQALQTGSIDATDVYSTDAKIKSLNLAVLTDDLHHFPEYNAVYLYRADLEARAPNAVAAIKRVEGQISEAEMVDMNARVEFQKLPERKVAAEFLQHKFAIDTAGLHAVESRASRIIARTREHLFMVAISLVAAILGAIPLGIIAAKWPRLGQIILAIAAIIYTIPSLALLVFLIPIFGITGYVPAIVALFLYSLLPMIRNTHAGLIEIPRGIRESAEALGLPPATRLRLIELPLASGAILAGVKTSAVINVATATLGALIGAGGYGQPILTGIRLSSTPLVLEGAIPAALLALIVQGIFELAERFIVPRGLRLKSDSARL